MQGLAAQERRKYEKAWAMPEYHNFSPGVHMMPMFRSMVRLKGKQTLLDIGAGAGAASKILKELGWDVTMLDHVKVKVEDKIWVNEKLVKNPVKSIPFIKANIWGRWNVPMDRAWDQGFCCDVMEHIPPEKVDKALQNILWYCHRVFFSISFMPDHFGKKVGHPLHLTVKPFEWWVEKLGEHGKVANARDLLGEGVFDVRT